jgi:hypothetical protein
MPPMKYWEIVADKLSAAGWSWGYCSAVTRDGWDWIVDAYREGRRYIVHSDELVSAFLGSDAAVMASATPLDNLPNCSRIMSITSPGCFNASSARLNKPQGLDLR